ncbi:MAG: iron-sulfur cluster assembly scaffold protein [Alphaproteobacteria bacterium]|nr:iron-sulfur cluster assembly scaffold protein [Alphaproteobacteria bacterium]
MPEKSLFPPHQLYDGRLKACAARIEAHPLPLHPQCSHTQTNPLCGDVVTIGVAKNSAGQNVFGTKTRGCLLCLAAATIVCEIGKATLPLSSFDAWLRAMIDAIGNPSPEVATRGDSFGILINQVNTSTASDLDALMYVRHFPPRRQCVTLPLQVAQTVVASIGDEPERRG